MLTAINGALSYINVVSVGRLICSWRSLLWSARGRFSLALMNGGHVESSRCSAGSVKELWPCPPHSSNGRCRPAPQLLNWGNVNASDVLLPYPSRPSVVSHKLSVRERHRMCRAHLVSHTLQRCSIGICLPDRLSRETCWGCRGSECTNSAVLFWKCMSL